MTPSEIASGASAATVLTQASVTTTVSYTYDGITLLSLAATQGATAAWRVSYLYGEDGRPYAGVYTTSTAAPPVTFLIATTDRGDVVALTDTAGNAFARYTYDPYGRVLTQTSNAVTGITSTVASQIRDRQPLRYAGYTYDTHSATCYLSQRYAAHNDMAANPSWSKTTSSLRKYVLTKKLGVKQSIYWNLVSYVSLGRVR